MHSIVNQLYFNFKKWGWQRWKDQANVTHQGNDQVIDAATLPTPDARTHQSLSGDNSFVHALFPSVCITRSWVIIILICLTPFFQHKSMKPLRDPRQFYYCHITYPKPKGNTGRNWCQREKPKLGGIFQFKIILITVITIMPSSSSPSIKYTAHYNNTHVTSFDDQSTSTM